MSGSRTYPAERITNLNEMLRGPLVTPEDEFYDDARAVYNAMIDRKPAAIAYCANIADVMAGVSAAAENDQPIAVRAGGHNGAGLGVCDDGIVLDLSRMRGIRVDPRERRIRVQGGATWGDVDHAAHAFGLGLPSGIISTTGVGGLTLGGGHGYLTRKYGLTIDSLISADVVLANGTFLTASEDENADLFWALRGGGGNFGIVTSFEFRLHPVKTVVAGPSLWPIERTAELLHWYSRFTEDASRDLYGFFQVLVVPPVDMFPRELHNRKMCGVLWCFLGSDEEANDQLIRRTDEPGKPVFEHICRMSYPALQSAFDALYPRGLQWYWKGHFIGSIDDESAGAIRTYGENLPSGHSTSHLYPIDGAVHDRKTGDTAFPAREARWSQVIAGVDEDPRQASRITEWARDFWGALRPHFGAGGYLNFMMDEGQERVRTMYGDNYDRLVDVKTKYDPANRFRFNQNIEPTA